MRCAALLVASLLVVTALPRHAQAQASQPQGLTREVFVNFGVGRVFRFEDRSFGTGLDLGGGFAVRRARLGVEFGVNRLSGFAQLVSPCAFPGCQGSSLSSATLASANVLYYLAGTRVQPYVTGGTGGFWSRATHSVVTFGGNVPTLTIVEDRDAGVSLNVGVGVRIAAGSRFSLRPEVRFYDTSIRSSQNLSVVRTSVNAAFGW
jgi:hypothetical protein